MKKINFLLTLTLIFLTSISNASVNGKGIYCKLTTTNNIKFSYELHSAFAFENNKYVQIIYQFYNDKFSYGINFESSFESFADIVKLSSPRRSRTVLNYSYPRPNKINRKTLEAKSKNEVLKMKCQKYDNFKSLKLKLDSINKNLENEYEKAIKKNQF